MIKDGGSVPVFTIKKKHAWRDRFLRFFSIFLISLVVLGTMVWFLVDAKFSFPIFFNNIGQRLKPEVRQDEKVKDETKEEELKKIIEAEKLVEIESITRTTESDLLLKTRSGQQIFFAIEKSLTDQVRTLQTLLTKAKIENKALKKVDFRFEKLVVEY